ncbi:hypothetical protein SmJEL517_g06058 [Synchytrium microbalum]|uniref:acetylornithine transaminase n=1 Tax=Synchytrium microbalum TaxID=1806994 RepID=A0A507BKJ8_9FUNG|nr:uncharacterized protein SmJEL517_g06058 [Synchytrium microbalum]TPX30357.1 hypothetical protein SmJEL517_g06058 [Synchytrium microbalum]
MKRLVTCQRALALASRPKLPHTRCMSALPNLAPQQATDNASTFSYPPSLPQPPAFTNILTRFSQLQAPTHLDCATHPSTMAKIAHDNKYLLQMYGRPNLIFSHGKGCYLYDMAGRQYLDLNSGIAVNALGHGDERLAKIIADQATKLIHLSNLYHNEYAGQLAELLVQALGNRGKWANTSEYGGSKVFLCNSGTEANEGAIKFARKWGKQPHQKVKEGKHMVISFSHAFHGRSLGALSATPNPKYQNPFTPLMPGFVNSPFNDTAKAIEIIDDKTCGVIVEPLQGEGGIFLGTDSFLSAIRKRCDEVGALLIMDEVQCGIGRTGKFFAHEHSGVTPDILTLAKPLANGLPAGAIIVAPHVAAMLKPGDHGTTFGGSPFATRVAIDVISRINNPSFLQRVAETGKYMMNQLQALADGTPLITEVRGRGLMIGLQLGEKVDSNAFVDLARERGLLLITAGNNTIRLVPPLIISRNEIDHAVTVLSSVVKIMEDKQ